MPYPSDDTSSHVNTARRVGQSVRSRLKEATTPKGTHGPAFMILFVATMTAAAGNTALQSVLPAIGRAFGYSDTLISAAFALSALFWTLTPGMWARLSERHGRKRMILVGLMGFTVSMIGIGASVSIGLAGWIGAGLALVFIVLSRSFYGFFGSATPTASQAYIADRTNRDERTEALSVQASAQGLGTVIGPALAPMFVLPFVGLSGPLYVFAVVGIVVFILVRNKLPSGEVPRQATSRQGPTRGLWKDPRVLPFVVFGFLITSTQAVNIAVLGFHVIDEVALPPLQAQSYVGIAMLAGAAATLMAQWGLIRIFHLEPKDLIRWGAALALTGNLLSAIAQDFYGVVLGYAVMSLGLGFARPGFMAGSSLALGAKDQGAIAGLMVSLMGLCFLGPPILGVALYELSAPAPFLVNGLMAAACVAMAFLWRPLAHAGVAVDPGETPTPPTP